MTESDWIENTSSAGAKTPRRTQNQKRRPDPKPQVAESEIDIVGGEYDPDYDVEIEADDPHEPFGAEAKETPEDEPAPGDGVQPRKGQGAPGHGSPPARIPSHLVSQAAQFGIDPTGMDVATLRDTIQDYRNDAIYRQSLKGEAKPEAPKEPDRSWLEGLDEHLVNYVKESDADRKASRDENTQLRNQLGQLAQERFAEKMDRTFDAITAEFPQLEGVFGKGSVFELSNPQLAQARNRILNTVSLDRADPRFPAAVKQAVRDLYGPTLAKAPADEEPEEKPAPKRNPKTGKFTSEEWRGTLRPSGQKAQKTGTPEQRAMAAVAKNLRSRGHTDTDEDIDPEL